MPKLVVDWGSCDSNGTCTLEAPALLQLDDDDMLVLLREEFGEELMAQAAAAVRCCPKQALRIAGE